ncbi:two-component sensor histidine kinase [Paenibacillus sambharensis]|uniref:Two-component sensor histidine kinase n=1 Tax=Paenibacillus sambharensis TaxID=1803190 RepID=A0A2W1LZJ1_9BACL|nr:histidine kinase [Paenibacillus sambharensis]PZD97111.1 two-component sensor histidine kinase [Paenibacillus sambharensis]
MIKFPAFSMRNSIFARLVFTYLIVVVPIILLGVYLYQWSYHNASNDITRATVKQLEYYLDGLNREIEWMELQLFDTVEDSGLNKLSATWSLMDSAEQRESLNELLSRLTSFQNSSPYMKDVSVHIRPINKTVSAVNAVQPLDEVRFHTFNTRTGLTGSRLRLWNGKLHLSASKQNARNGEDPIFIVQIELDSEKLRRSLNQINLYKDSGSLLILEENEYTIRSHPQSDASILQFVQKASSTSDNEFRMEMNGKSYHLNKVYSQSLGLSVAAYLPEETVKRPLSKFYTWGLLFALTSLLAVVAFSYFSYQSIHRPLLYLVQGFKRMENGSLNTPIEHERKDEFGYLYTRYNQMLNKLQSLIDQDFKQKMMMQRAELKQLQSQINPHFLYNSFFILNSLARTGDLERIELFTNMLGEYFRFITRNGEDHVPLSEEVKHSRIYSEIQKLRFSRRIRVQFDELPAEMERIRVPRLIIQPIIENAYEHSLEKMAEEGIFRLTFEHTENEICITIEDNGSSISDSDILALQSRVENTVNSFESTGLLNIHRRLVLTFGAGSGLKLSRSELNGLKVSIRIRREDTKHV